MVLLLEETDGIWLQVVKQRQTNYQEVINLLHQDLVKAVVRLERLLLQEDGLNLLLWEWTWKHQLQEHQDLEQHQWVVRPQDGIRNQDRLQSEVDSCKLLFKACILWWHQLQVKYHTGKEISMIEVDIWLTKS
jgi:hypothetical protein